MPGGAYENWDAPGQGGAVGRVHNPVVERRQPEYHLSDRDDIHADEMTARAGGAGGSPWGNKQLAQRLRTHGDHTASYGNRGSPSIPSSSTANIGPVPGRHYDQPDHLANPPPPGQHPSFDSKVAAEFLRLREAKGEGTGRGSGATGERSPQQRLLGGPAARAPGLGPPPAFESDVEQVMRDMEQELTGTVGGAKPVDPASRAALPLRDGPSPGRGWGQGTNGGRKDAAAPASMGSFAIPEGRRSLLPAPPPPPVVRPGAEHHHDGILSQMEMHRAPPGGGKGRSGGLKDLWGGGSDGYAPKQQQQQQQVQRGGSLGSMWSDQGGGGRDGGVPVGQGYSPAPRRGPGLKAMWGGDEPASGATLRPQRQGPGLRGLWSGPDMAAADAARTEAQAAYLSALDRDVQERRAFSDEPLKMHQVRDRHAERESPYGGEQGGVGGGGGGGGRILSEYGTSLAGIGADSGAAAPTPRRTSHQRRESEAGGGYQDRSAEKARKAAYAEELRKQIAEKESRAAETESASKGSRRRASTGGWGGRDHGETAAPQPFGGEGDPYRRGAEADAGQQLSSNGFPTRYRDGSHDSPTASTATSRDSFPANWLNRQTGSSAQQVSVPGGPGNGEAHVTTARRRLVEDVYGGSGMGAALSGSGYRRSSTGGCGNVGGGAGGGPSADVRGVGPVGGGGDAAATLAANGTSHLRTGAGVQSLNESEHDGKWQRRAAALEQQRALQEQISAKMRAKKEEEDKRKREEEEEARQQRERLCQMEAAADEERRRKQAEQQEQLEGLYRQQEAALRKKRGGAGIPRDESEGRSDDRKDFRAPPYDMPTLRGDTGHPLGVGESPRKSPIQHRADAAGTSAIGGTPSQTPRRRATVPDVDDLPAGAQARAQVMRNSPPLAGGSSAPSPLRGPGSATSNHRSVSGSSTPKERRGGSPAASGRYDHGAGVEIGADEINRTARVRGGRHGSMAGRNAEGGAGVTGARGGAGRSPVPPAAAPAGRESRRTSAGVDEPPLRAHSALVPVSSETLFPTHLQGQVGAGGHVEAMPSFAPPTRAGGAERLKRSPGASGNSAPAGLVGSTDGVGDAGGGVQDEMDAFVASWQTEHLRRRRQEGSLVDEPSPLQRAAPGGRRTSDGYPGPSSGPHAFGSPSRDLLRSSSARAANKNRGAGAGREQDLEASLVATSRMIGPSPPLPPPAREKAAAGWGGVGVGGQGRRTQRQTPVGGGADASEQSLVSDSMLFYLTGAQRDRMKASGPGPTRAGNWTSRAETLSESRPDVREDLGRGQDSRREERGGRHGGASPPPASLLSPRQAAAGYEGDDLGQMSPLTRLLAETPVRLATGGHLPKRGVDPGRPGPPDAEYPTRAGDGSRDPDTVAGARRARALWGASAEGEGTVAEALTRRGGGTPWEEMSELRLSSSRAP